MSVGILKNGDNCFCNIWKVKGNPVFFVGSATGKDGIGGATFASADITADSAEDLPAVQVGDPFQEKKLLEACLGSDTNRCSSRYAGYGCCRNHLFHFEMSAKGECRNAN